MDSLSATELTRSRNPRHDAVAFPGLTAQAARRLERMSCAALRTFPNVRRWIESGDLLQIVLLRLMRSLPAIGPVSPSEFYALAALQMRRELLDLARSRRVRDYQAPGVDHLEELVDPACADADDAEDWGALHEAVASLPALQREVLSLEFYHGWPQERVAELLGVSARTVRRYRQQACAMLATRLRDAREAVV